MPPISLLSPKVKFKRTRKTKNEEEGNLVIESAVRHSGSCSEPLYSYIFTCGQSSQRTVGLFGGSWSLLCHHCWPSLGLFLDIRLLPLSCSSWFRGLTLPLNPHLHLQQITDGVDVRVCQHITLVLDLDGVDVRVCQHITLVLDLGGCRFGPPANSYQRSSNWS